LLAVEHSHCAPHGALVHVGVSCSHLDRFVSSGFLNDLLACRSRTDPLSMDSSLIIALTYLIIRFLRCPPLLKWFTPGGAVETGPPA
jgi:hypothetical protein